MGNIDLGNRPLSPHLTIYGWHIPMLTSILIRVTGSALIVSALLVVWWFLAAAVSPDYFAFANWLLTSWLGDLVMTLSVLGLWYHLLGGIRHLIFDSGHGLELETAELLGKICLIGSVVLTVLTLMIMLML